MWICAFGCDIKCISHYMWFCTGKCSKVSLGFKIRMTNFFYKDPSLWKLCLLVRDREVGEIEAILTTQHT